MRDVAATREEALRQLRDGLNGENITKRQTEMGVKDGVVTHFLQGTSFLDIENTVQDTFNATELDSEDQIVDELLDPAVTDEVTIKKKTITTTKAILDKLSDDEKVNPFLSVRGESLQCFECFFTNYTYSCPHRLQSS